MLLSLAGVAYVVLMVGLGRALRASGVVIFWAC
jgi:hypothetical protein